MRITRLQPRRTANCGSVLLFALFCLVSEKNFAGDGVDLNIQRIGKGNVDQGKILSDAGRCQECHGIDGLSSDERIPNHAGQFAGYLVKQLQDFQSGNRNHQTMNLMAEDLTATEITDIASYFASHKPMQGQESGENSLAKNLFQNGDPARDLPACTSCHGELGKGRVAEQIYYPLIGGQNRVYLRSQLVNWQLGDRNNSPDGKMSKIAKVLTTDEINALANYISGL